MASERSERAGQEAGRGWEGGTRAASAANRWGGLGGLGA